MADYPDDEVSDGTALILDGAWSYAFDLSLNVSLNAGFDRVTSGIDYNAYKAYSAGFSLYKELPFGITTDLSGEVRLAEFDDVMLFPYNKVREDTRWSGSVNSAKATSTCGVMRPRLNILTSITTATSQITTMTRTSGFPPLKRLLINVGCPSPPASANQPKCALNLPRNSGNSPPTP